MSYAPSPRPTFSGPAHIPYAAVSRHLWGDDESGRVTDWIYVSSDKIHQLVFGLGPRGAFRHSDSFRTIFAADEVLYVLSGSAAFSNPEAGEVHRVDTGEAIFFRRDTWHHCFSVSDEPLRVLELFAPPPSTGTSGAYAQSKENLIDSKYDQARWMGRWPMAAAQSALENTIRVLRRTDRLWKLEGSRQQLLVGILAATEHLTVGQVELLPGTAGEPHRHAGDESIYLRSGSLHIHLPENDGPQWFELAARDGFFIPEGVPHAYHNFSGEPADLIFGVAPGYAPGS